MNYWIWFSQVDGFGPIQKKILLDKFKTPEKIYLLKTDELINIKGIRENSLNNFEKSKDTALVNSYEKYMNTHGIKILNYNDKNYPQNLKNIYDAPISLFVKGNSEILNNLSVGIVGCRNATKYGLENAFDFAYEFSKLNINVVSGLAKGIDNEAHRGALKKDDGKTIAVLGCGVDIIYPMENANTYKEILRNGAIISEYIVGTKPKPQNFVARNRIISGISDALVVVEAKEKSGTMITTDFALEQGKTVFAVPR